MKKMTLYIGDKQIAEAIASDSLEFTERDTANFSPQITGYIGEVKNLKDTPDGFIFQLCDLEVEIKKDRPEWLQDGVRIELDLYSKQIWLLPE